MLPARLPAGLPVRLPGLLLLLGPAAGPLGSLKPAASSAATMPASAALEQFSYLVELLQAHAPPCSTWCSPQYLEVMDAAVPDYIPANRLCVCHCVWRSCRQTMHCLHARAAPHSSPGAAAARLFSSTSIWRLQVRSSASATSCSSAAPLPLSPSNRCSTPSTSPLSPLLLLLAAAPALDPGLLPAPRSCRCSFSSALRARPSLSACSAARRAASAARRSSSAVAAARLACSAARLLLLAVAASSSDAVRASSLRSSCSRS